MATIILYLIPTLIVGILLGCAVALVLTANSVAASNDHGDSKGNFHDFATQPLTVRERRDNIRLPFKI